MFRVTAETSLAESGNSQVSNQGWWFGAFCAFVFLIRLDEVSRKIGLHFVHPCLTVRRKVLYVVLLCSCTVTQNVRNLYVGEIVYSSHISLAFLQYTCHTFSWLIKVVLAFITIASYAWHIMLQQSVHSPTYLMHTSAHLSPVHVILCKHIEHHKNQCVVHVRIA